MYYQQLLVALFEPFVAIETSRQATNEVTVLDKTPQEIVRDAKCHFDTLFRLFYLRHSFVVFDPLLVLCSNSLGYIVIKDLHTDTFADEDTIRARRSTLLLTIKALRDQSRSCYLGEAASYLMKDSAGTEAEWLMREFAHVDGDEEERKELLIEHVHSQWPVRLIGVNDDPNNQEMDQLAQQVRDVDISEPTHSGHDATTSRQIHISTLLND
jgi:hypothetical protein